MNVTITITREQTEAVIAVLKGGPVTSEQRTLANGVRAGLENGLEMADYPQPVF